MLSVLNATACAALLDNLSETTTTQLLQMIILIVLDVLVIVGNCLVIAAVFCSSKLRSVTNLFIVSLAVADLMVGVAVLPFSATWEVFKVWIFGETWCSIWLAVDVWMCTASILNLCAISLDRYVAVTRPVTYPSIMSHSRAKMLIAGIWVLSFAICFPPLIGWQDKERKIAEPRHNQSAYDYASNDTARADDDEPEYYASCPYTCELEKDFGYVLYSALGSFYIPMFVMLFFYWRIYLAAVRTTKAINVGFRTTKAGSKGIGNRFDDQRLTLRIHRGRSMIQHGSHGSPHSNGGGNSTTTTTPGSVSPASARSHRGTPAQERIKINVSYASNEHLAPPDGNSLVNTAPSSPTGHPTFAVHYSVNGKEQSETLLYREGSRDSNNFLRVQSAHARRSNSCDAQIERELLTQTQPETHGKRKVISRRMGKRNIKAQVKRFKMETKAAKTLGIIVGGFIFCWLPFFTIYLIRGFCDACINPIVFSVLFWMGYCNSAINPLIYALFSKDFRFAFKRIICKCFCSRAPNATGSRRGSDGSQMQGRQFRSSSYNTNHGFNSLGDDSDPCGDASEVR